MHAKCFLAHILLLYYWNIKRRTEVNKKELSHEELYWNCDESCISADTTEEMETEVGVIGQERAVEAIEFGMGIESNGFNVFVMGPSGAGRTSIVKWFVEESAKKKEIPDDWCYVRNFNDNRRPNAISLPAGKGKEFRDDIDKLAENLRSNIERALEQEDFEKEKSQLMSNLQKQQSDEISSLEKEAREAGFTIQRGPQGFVIVPLKEDGDPMGSEEMSELPEDKRDEIHQRGEKIREKLQSALRKIRSQEAETKEQVQDLEKNTILFAVEYYIDDLKEKYSDFDEVIDFIDAIKDDVAENASEFTESSQQGQQNPLQRFMPDKKNQIFDRYSVNLIVDNSDTEGAPVIMEGRPTFQKLMGKIERQAQLGMLMTDFTMIKPGDFHRANGGYLILEASHLFQYPYSYIVLKHALKEGEIRITDATEIFQTVSTESLEPEPIPLNIKVILIGNPFFYYMLHNLDEEFAELFKVKADFNTFMDNKERQIAEYSRFLASQVKEEGWNHFDRGGIARMVEYGAELTGDRTRLSTRFSDICDLGREANYHSEKNGSRRITRENVQQAIDAKKRRSNRIEEIIQDMITEGDIFIDTEKSVTGQVNGLSVMNLGDYMFGRPSRITARTYVGRSGVVNIDREVELSGPIHSKGVLILSGYVNGNFGKQKPVSLAASIVFEQQYGGIDGDSASSGELYALLSALADSPLNQSIAITGSVNQHGEIQPIGGVTQKIEGFFDVCKTIGLTGDQGVIIPEKNRKNLMLKSEVVESVEAGKFHIYPISAIGEGMEILTGEEFGEMQDDGTFPEGTINRRIDDRLNSFAEAWTQYSSKKEGGAS
jgi:lon-related putative ATP-dependent protease